MRTRTKLLNSRMKSGASRQAMNRSVCRKVGTEYSKNPNVERPDSRTGAAMVFALVALLVASMMIAALLKMAGMSHRQLQRDQFRLQCSLLADAGCARALAMIAADPSFQEAEWQVPAEQLSLDRTAVVRVRVIPADAKASNRRVVAVAEYPVGDPNLVRITRQMEIP